MFFIVAPFAFLIGLIEATEDGEGWSDKAATGLLVFAIASLIAGAMAAVPTGSARRPLIGLFSLIVGVLVMAQYKGSGDSGWLILIAAIGLVLFGGLLSGGLWTKLTRTSTR